MELYKYKIPITSRQWSYREGLILRIGEGFGEIAPLPGFSRESFAQAEEQLLNWIRFQTPPTLPSVRFGIASAQKSLRSISLPLCALGPKPGFRTVKLKLGHLCIKEAVELVKTHYRQFRLRLDCNRAWTLSQALEFASHFQADDFSYLEEPVQTFEELIQFSKLTHFPLAIDESIHQDWSQIPSLKAIVVKPTVVGEIPSIPSHIDLVLSSSYETGLGLLHIAHLSSSPLPVGLDTYHAFQEDILTSPIHCSSGFFSWNASDSPIDFSKLTKCAL